MFDVRETAMADKALSSVKNLFSKLGLKAPWKVGLSLAKQQVACSRAVHLYPIFYVKS